MVWCGDRVRRAPNYGKTMTTDYRVLHLPCTHHPYVYRTHTLPLCAVHAINISKAPEIECTTVQHNVHRKAPPHRRTAALRCSTPTPHLNLMGVGLLYSRFLAPFSGRTLATAESVLCILSRLPATGVPVNPRTPTCLVLCACMCVQWIARVS